MSEQTETTTAGYRLVTADESTVVDESGQSGGPDYNLGREFSKRYTWSAPDGTYRTLTFTTYVQAHDADGELVEWDELAAKQEELARWEAARAAVEPDPDGFLSPALDRWEESHPCPLRYVWSEVTETAAHEVVDEIDDADYEYGEGSYTFFATVADAEEDARAAVDRMSPDYCAPEHFDA